MLTKNQVIKQLKEVIDPELNVNIVDLGLVYGIKIKPTKKILKQIQHDKGRVQDDKRKKEYDVNITMTLTSPGCPLSEMFDVWVKDSVKKIKGVKNVTIDLVWEPAWSPERMNEEVRENLGML